MQRCGHTHKAEQTHCNVKPGYHTPTSTIRPFEVKHTNQAQMSLLAARAHPCSELMFSNDTVTF